MIIKDAESNAAALIANANGSRIQYRPHDSSIWYDITPQISKDWDFQNYVYRPKPEPVSRPWDFNSRPREVVWVYQKGFITDSMIVTWGDDAVVIATKHGMALVPYGDLFNKWLKRDGSPCGTTEEPA